MQLDGNRHARNNDALTAPATESRRGCGLRGAVSLVAAALIAAALVPVAQAATGGASSSPPPTASTSDSGELAFTALRVGEASWYGPGLYGKKTACGETLSANTLGVAHKKLPCGTTVKFLYHGHSLVTQVIDRGPYVKGRAWDLTAAASEALDLEGVGDVRYAIAREYARPGPKG
jgi:rare lipoprotein A (peptidoglycan hydrolase)